MSPRLLFINPNKCTTFDAEVTIEQRIIGANNVEGGIYLAIRDLRKMTCSPGKHEEESNEQWSERKGH